MSPAPKFSQTVQSLQEKRGAARLRYQKEINALSEEPPALEVEPRIYSTTATDTEIQSNTMNTESDSSWPLTTPVLPTQTFGSNSIPELTDVGNWHSGRQYEKLAQEPRILKLAEGIGCSTDQVVDKLVVWMTDASGNQANWGGRTVEELVNFYLDNFYLS